MSTSFPTARQFRAKAEQMFRRANPDAIAVGHVLRWEFTGPKTVDASGSPARFGHFTVVAPGFAARRMYAAYSTSSGWSVR